MWWDQWRNMNNTDFYLPFPFIINKVDNAKEGSDSYHVYVNGDYVGDKTAIIQGEEGSKAIKDYLQSRGFNNFKIETEGNRIQVQTEEETEEDNIKRHLSVYLSIR